VKEKNQFQLLLERRFGPLFGVQFLGAVNDNLFKQALVILLAYQTASFTSLSSEPESLRGAVLGLRGTWK